MEKQTCDNQTIVQYLLGSLPEEETERLDELSFIDDEFAERLDAVEADLVDAYVKGELSDRTLDRFGSYYLTSPRRREKVGFAHALQTIADKAVATGQVVFEQEPPPATAASDKPFSRWTSLLGFFTLPRLALAAAAMLTLAAGGWVVFELSRLRGQVDQAQVRHDALEQREKDLREMLEQQQRASSVIEKELEQVRNEKIRLDRQMAMERQIANLQPVPFTIPAQKRDSDPATAILIPPGIDYLPLRIEIEPDEYRRYRIVLLTEPGGKPAGWRRERLREKTIGESQVLDIRIPAKLLKPREYALEVAGISGSGVIEDESKRAYSFRVVKQ